MASMDILDVDHRQTAFGRRQYFLNTPFDSFEHSTVVDMIARASPGERFRYIVTPNADHVVRLNREPSLRPLYDRSWLTLCDSRPISLFAQARSRTMTHVTGSDLTVSLFRSVIRAGDRITLIVGTEKVGRDVRAAYPDVDFSVHVPPMGLWRNPRALEECVEFAVRAQGRLTFIAVGAPQSEKIAYMLSNTTSATGIGLCIGAALEFLVGAKKRAPLWMQKASLEWLYRMVSDRKRLWRRYVFGMIPLLMLFSKEIRGRFAESPVAGASPQR